MKMNSSIRVFLNGSPHRDVPCNQKRNVKLLSTKSRELIYITSRRTLQSKTERKIIEHQEQGIDLHLFIKKSDLDDPDHYYLGQVDVIAGTAQQERVNGQNIVTMDLALRESVPYKLFHYFINE